MLRPVFVILVLLLGGSACSEDKSTTSGSATSEAEPDPEVQQLADDAVLTLDDLPTGWEKSPRSTPEEQAEEDEVDEDFAECVGMDPADLENSIAKAESSFSNADDQEISAEVAVMESEEDAATDMEQLRDPKTHECFVEIFGGLVSRNILESGDDVEIGEITLNELSFDDLGDDSEAFRLTLPLSQDGFDVDVFIDFVVVAKGRIGVTSSFTSIVTPFDEDLALEITETMVDRISANA